VYEAERPNPVIMTTRKMAILMMKIIIEQMPILAWSFQAFFVSSFFFFSFSLSLSYF